MRGIEVSLRVLKDIRKGKFASESIRRYGQKMDQKDRILLSLLVNTALRRSSLWENIAARFLRDPSRRLSPDVKDALILGTAGILELNHFLPGVLVNALVQGLKSGGNAGGAKLVNAVLRKVADEGRARLLVMEKSEKIEDRCLLAGVPLWAAWKWEASMGHQALLDLLDRHRMKTYLSLRVSPGEDPREIAEHLGSRGYRAWPSPLLTNSVRLAGSAHPPDLPGFSSGKITPQSESSIMVGNIVTSLWSGEPLVDMCMGRAIKLGQISQFDRHASIEGWELSAPRVSAARKELDRLGRSGQVSIKIGNALMLEPSIKPQMIFLDAPCSGSGTWNRHPESKWKLSEKIIEDNSKIQKKLLYKALSMVETGGIVVYATCSLFSEENENVVRSVMERMGDAQTVEIPVQNKHIRKTDPSGVYIWPDQPWLDGFFVSAIARVR
jgi:16S rRNA (cytosine967-C5)-methyltransferase